MNLSPRNTTRRNKFRRIIARDQPPCHLCGGEIRYDIQDHLHPQSFTIDHIVPISLGGSDTLDNVAAACRRCNIARQAKPLTQPQAADPRLPPGVQFITHRDWTTKPSQQTPARA